MSIKPALVVRTITSHPQIRVFHTTVRISETITQSYELSPTFVRNIPKTKKLPKRFIGKTGIQLIQRLQRIPGITRISISPYILNIRIGDAFSWDTLMEVATLAILECYPVPPQETVSDQKLLELSKYHFTPTKNTKTPT